MRVPMIKGSKEIPPRYRRGQMEWALWRQFSHLGDQCRTPAPPVFLNRIKRMLDLDRAQNADVFSYGGSAKGRFVDYAEYSVFLMALALILLDAGFKQGDVLFLLRHMKGQLEEPYLRIMDTP